MLDNGIALYQALFYTVFLCTAILRNDVAKLLCDKKIHSGGERRNLIILVLEGIFGCHTRNDKLIRNELRKSIEKRLKRLNCTV